MKLKRDIKPQGEMKDGKAVGGTQICHVGTCSENPWMTRGAQGPGSVLLNSGTAPTTLPLQYWYWYLSSAARLISTESPS